MSEEFKRRRGRRSGVQIYQNAKGRYRGRCRHCHHKHGTGPFESFDEALKWAREHEATARHQKLRAVWVDRRERADRVAALFNE